MNNQMSKKRQTQNPMESNAFNLKKNLALENLEKIQMLVNFGLMLSKGYCLLSYFSFYIIYKTMKITVDFRGYRMRTNQENR